MYMPNNNDLTAMNNYLTSPNFQTNTTYGDFIGATGNGMNNMPSNFFPSAPAAPGGPAGGGMMGGMGGMDGLKLLVGGLSSIGNLWNSFQATKIAKDTLKFQKEYAQKNLVNQTQSYNTALTDRVTSRAYTQGNDQAYVDDYLSKNKLSA